MTRLTAILAAFAMTLLPACGARFVKEFDYGNTPTPSFYVQNTNADGTTRNIPVVEYHNITVHDVWISAGVYGGAPDSALRKPATATGGNLTVYFDPADPRLDAGITFAEGTTFHHNEHTVGTQPDVPLHSVQVTGVTTDMFVQDNAQVQKFFGSAFRWMAPRMSDSLWQQASMDAIYERTAALHTLGEWGADTRAQVSWNGETPEPGQAFGRFNYSKERGLGQARVEAFGHRNAGVDFFVMGESN